MKKIVVQAGHINCQFNSIVGLRTSTGAPGEQELTLRIANRLSEILRLKGFEVKQTDANANDDRSITEKDWDLFVALHGDADAAGNNGGGCVGFPEPSTDAATIESQRIAKDLVSEYFNHSGIVNVPGKITNNIKFYYMWASLSAKTPCILVEMGEVQDAHDKVILADTDRVANALARGICKTFSVPFEIPPPTVDYKKKWEDEHTAFEKYKAEAEPLIISLEKRLSSIATIATISNE